MDALDGTDMLSRYQAYEIAVGMAGCSWMRFAMMRAATRWA